MQIGRRDLLAGAALAVGLPGAVRAQEQPRRGGTVCVDDGRKAVEILPLGLTYAADSLKIR